MTAGTARIASSTNKTASTNLSNVLESVLPHWGQWYPWFIEKKIQGMTQTPHVKSVTIKCKT